MSQNTFSGARKSRQDCVGTVSSFLVNISLHPFTHSAWKVSRNSTERAQKNSKAVCLSLNSALFMYRQTLTMIASSLGLPLVPPASDSFIVGSGCAMWHDHTALRRAEGVKVESVGSGAACAEERAFKFESTRAFSCGSKFDFLSTASVPERTLMPSDLSGLSVLAFEGSGARGTERSEYRKRAKRA